jgi:ABC-type transport system involved in multi-copper enzyme maturation permease subunit
MGPFVTIALDVPRRLARNKILWLLVVVIGLLLVFGAAPIGFDTEGKLDLLTYWGKELSKPLEPEPDFRFKIATSFLTLVFAKALASCAGVFTGILLLADAVTSAFAPGAAEVTLPKPVSRGAIVLARHLGAVLVALGLVTFLVGGAVAILYVRTGELCLSVLVAIPLTVLQFAVLHAVGTISGLVFQNAFLGALASAGVWVASWLTGLVGALAGALDPAKPHDDILTIATRVAAVAHRTIPRAADFPDLVQRIPTRNFGTLPGGVASEVEIMAQALLWTGFALGVATLIVSRRDY